MTPPFLTRVVLRNYKSIAACNLEMRSLMFLVGPNGSGKSNFLDALRFVADSLTNSLDHALRERGGIKEVRRRSGGHPTHFSIRVQFEMEDGRGGLYAFRVGAQPQGGYQLQDEECRIGGPDPFAKAFYTVDGGELTRKSMEVAPALVRDRLYLANAAGLPEFRPLYDALTHMGFYNLNPARIRDLQPPDAGELLDRDGGNLASVLGRMGSNGSPARSRIQEYLETVVPGIQAVDVRTIGPRETIEFRQQVAGSPEPWRFLAASMSDGTVRALGVLVALFQGWNGQGARPTLVGIEEPEVALHPAAAGVLLGSLVEASRSTQVLVTSHSPDLLDSDEVETKALVAVVAEKGTSHLGPVDETGREVLVEGLYTPGELLRLNQLRPERRSRGKIGSGQETLFGGDDA